MGNITETMNARAAECKDMEELEAFFSQHEDDMVGFDTVMRHLLNTHNLSVEEFIAMYGRSCRRNIEDWLDGISAPYKRSEYIKIAILLNMSLNEANVFLTRACGCGRLYPKNIDDAACIHVLIHHLGYNEYLKTRVLMRNEIEEIAYCRTKDFFPEDYNKERDALEKDEHYFEKVAELNQNYFDREKKIKQRKNRLFTNAWEKKEKYLRQTLLANAKQGDITFVGTEVLMDTLSETTDMVQYVRDNWEAILASNYKLLAYIEKLFDKCELVGTNGKKVNTINALVTYYMDDDVIDDTVGNKLTTFFSRMRTNCATDIDRNYIILLGILFELDVEEINTMMDIAHMDYLCAKNHGEATIISALGKGSRDPQEVMDILSISDYSDYLSVKNLLLKFFSKEDLEDYGLI